MRIIFYESANHYEVIGAYLSHFYDDASINFIIHSNSSVKKELKNLFPPNHRIQYRSLSETVENQNEEYAILIVSSPILLKKIKRTGKLHIFYVIHNINFNFNVARNISIHSLMNFGKAIRSLMYSYSLRSTYKQVKGFIFLSPNLKSYFKKVHPLNQNQLSLIWPTILNKAYFSEVENRNKAYFAIPGHTDDLRRDYSTIFSALNELRDHKLKFFILGKITSRYKKIIETLNRHQITIKYFENGVNYIQYYNYLSASKAIILPLKKHKIYNGIKEEIGKSTYSATLIDTLAVQKPGIIPGFIELEKDIENAFLRFNSAGELVNILKSTIDTNQILDVDNYLQKYTDQVKKELINLTFD